MKVDRLFNVLVLGGAAIAASCSDDKGPAAETGTAQGGTGGASATVQGSGGADTSGSSTGGSGTGGTGGAESDASAQAGSGGTGGAATTDAELKCSVHPAPNDSCGCPCCWGNCLNIEPCCEAFRAACTPP